MFRTVKQLDRFRACDQPIKFKDLGLYLNPEDMLAPTALSWFPYRACLSQIYYKKHVHLQATVKLIKWNLIYNYNVRLKTAILYYLKKVEAI